MFSVLGLVGSLRVGSHNRRLLLDIAASAPAGVEIAVFDQLQAVPLFDEDVEDRGVPPGVVALAAAVAGADAIVIATPEYNQSMPGVLKNALDWLSRSSVGSPLRGKPAAVTGATTGTWGTRLAQRQIRGTLLACGAWVMPSPFLFVPRAGAEDWDGSALTDFGIALRADLLRLGGAA